MRERKIYMRDINWPPLVCAPSGNRIQTRNPGMCPNQNQTGDPLPCRTMPNRASYTSQDIGVAGILNAKTLNRVHVNSTFLHYYNYFLTHFFLDFFTFEMSFLLNYKFLSPCFSYIVLIF